MLGGADLVRTLRSQNPEVIGIDVLSSQFTSEVGSSVEGTLVKRCMKGVTDVLHAATLQQTARCHSQQAKLYRHKRDGHTQSANKGIGKNNRARARAISLVF
jgi:nucleoside-diphosphate-sugar epimerase